MNSLKRLVITVILPVLSLAGLSACGGILPTPSLAPTQIISTDTILPSTATTSAPTFTATSLPPTPTSSATPTLTPTPTITLTPTATIPDTPQALINQQAHCRYGPGTSYLHAGDLYPSQQYQIDGRNSSSTWLWILLPDEDRHCWVSASVITILGDVSNTSVVASKLPYTTWSGPPENLRAERNGDQVSIYWSQLNVPPEDYRGFMLILNVCQGGSLINLVIHTDETSYTVTDEGGCSQASSGVLYGVEKHGYTTPLDIPWP